MSAPRKTLMDKWMALEESKESSSEDRPSALSRRSSGGSSSASGSPSSAPASGSATKNNHAPSTMTSATAAKVRRILGPLPTLDETKEEEDPMASAVSSTVNHHTNHTRIEQPYQQQQRRRLRQHPNHDSDPNHHHPPRRGRSGPSQSAADAKKDEQKAKKKRRKEKLPKLPSLLSLIEVTENEREYRAKRDHGLMQVMKVLESDLHQMMNESQLYTPRFHVRPESSQRDLRFGWKMVDLCKQESFVMPTLRNQISNLYLCKEHPMSSHWCDIRYLCRVMNHRTLRHSSHVFSDITNHTSGTSSTSTSTSSTSSSRSRSRSSSSSSTHHRRGGEERVKIEIDEYDRLTRFSQANKKIRELWDWVCQADCESCLKKYRESCSKVVQLYQHRNLLFLDLYCRSLLFRFQQRNQLMSALSNPTPALSAATPSPEEMGEKAPIFEYDIYGRRWVNPAQQPSPSPSLSELCAAAAAAAGSLKSSPSPGCSSCSSSCSSSSSSSTALAPILEPRQFYAAFQAGLPSQH